MFMCMYCMNCFFIKNVTHLPFYVNTCACHVYFTINLLTTTKVQVLLPTLATLLHGQGFQLLRERLGIET